jgi:hypothetical protein
MPNWGRLIRQARLVPGSCAGMYGRLRPRLGSPVPRPGSDAAKPLGVASRT